MRMSRAKIKTLEELTEIVAKAKADGRKVVHCHGVFDLLHIGHIRYFEQARSMGDMLVVTVTPDRFVNKGPGRPAFPQELRLEAVAALDVVDYVAENRWPMAVETLRMLKPDVYVKGSEYKDAEKDVTGGITLEREAVESAGGKLAFTDDIVFSSSSLINKYASVFPKQVADYLAGFNARFGDERIVEYLEKARDLKVLVVGETIIDEYEYCQAIGKSSKEPTLAVKSLYSEAFAGGILAVANHVANFVDNVSLVTFLGDRDSRADFVREKLNPAVNATLLRRTDSPTIVKKRLIEQYYFQKMLEVYAINDDAYAEADEQSLSQALESQVPEHDLVIVVDFGHGMMGRQAVDVVSKRARFLALNAQANAGNMGYNVVTKYPRADFVTMAETELRLEARDRRGDLRIMLETVAGKLACRRVVVTRGKHGCLCYDAEEGFFHIPSVAGKVVDRVGAGDAFLSISALCAALGAPTELVGFVGNAVGAWSVSTVCNEESIQPAALIKQIRTLLK